MAVGARVWVTTAWFLVLQGDPKDILSLHPQGAVSAGHSLSPAEALLESKVTVGLEAPGCSLVVECPCKSLILGSPGWEMR